MLVVIVLIVVCLLSICVYRYLDGILSAQVQLSSSEIGRPSNVKVVGTAVVVGGSISGIIAASTLSPLSKQVFLIEKRKIPEDSSVADQGNQVHIFLSCGIDIIAKIFPNFIDAIIKKGAVRFDALHDCKSIGIEGPFASCEKGEGGVYGYSISRACVEVVIRRLALETFKNIQVIDEAEVIRLEGTKDHVTGLTYKNLDQEEITIQSDLFVDASGLYGISARLLNKQYGINIEKKKVKSYIEYISCRYAPRPEYKVKNPIIFYRGHPPHKPYGGISQLLEDGNLIIMLGMFKTPMSTNRESFEDFFKEKQMHLISEIIENSDPIGSVFSFKKEGSQYNYFENLNMKGMIALGDAVCSFNPVYGQGMTCAAEGCLLLDQLLRNRKPFSCQEYQKRLCKIVTLPWLLATNADLCFPGTQGGSSFQRMMIPRTIKANQEVAVKLARSKETHIDVAIVMNMTEGTGWRILTPLWLRKLFGYPIVPVMKPGYPVW
ncbi:hypothetical protein AKO1_014886 [Acrasis kona]|uniref:Squalene monooxygenase n=1 Tax=Acrasis kona TaxID=1008807 RepID=A0AAW2Z2K1_9EUKA